MVGFFILNYSMLMYAGFVYKGICTYNRFVWRNFSSKNRRKQSGCLIYFREVYIMFNWIAFYFKSNDNFFKSSISRTFTNSTDGTLNLFGTTFNSGNTICNRKPQIIMAMCGYYNITWELFS